MSKKTATVKLRRGTAAAWTSLNETLNRGEPGFEIDTKKLKIGDGNTPWNSLPYVAGANGNGGISLEDVDTRVVQLLEAGDGINIEYDDENLTISAVLETLLTAGEGINFDFNEQNNVLTVSVTGVSLVGHTHTLNQITDYKEKAYINYFDFDSNSVTIIIAEDVWYKLNTTTTSVFSRNGLVHSNNRITNTNEISLIVQMEGIASLSANNNTEIHISFFKNDTLIPCAEQVVTTSARGNVFFTSAVPFQCITELEPNDYLEVWVKNKNTTDNITLTNINVIVKEL
jgi:hypothetical protein